MVEYIKMVKYLNVINEMYLEHPLVDVLKHFYQSSTTDGCIHPVEVCSAQNLYLTAVLYRHLER